MTARQIRLRAGPLDLAGTPGEHELREITLIVEPIEDLDTAVPAEARRVLAVNTAGESGWALVVECQIALAGELHLHSRRRPFGNGRWAIEGVAVETTIQELEAARSAIRTTELYLARGGRPNEVVTLTGQQIRGAWVKVAAEWARLGKPGRPDQADLADQLHVSSDELKDARKRLGMGWPANCWPRV